MIEVIGGDLYQWDISRSVRIKPEQGKQVQKANFSNADIETARVATAVKDGDYYIADIPDELLKSDQKLTCYAVMIDPDEEKTIEQASFKVNRRNRPDDYDINASTELRSMCDDILGEVVGNTIFDKLAYMKDCLDILYQSAPIKLMREVYGENRSLKELFSYIVLNENINYINLNGRLIYENSKFTSGFNCISIMCEFPNGELRECSVNYIAPCVYLPTNIYDDCFDKRIVIDPSLYAPWNKKMEQGTIEFIDFRNIHFPVEDTPQLFENMYRVAGIKIAIRTKYLIGIWMPKITKLESNCFDITNLDELEGECLFPNGIHFGKYVNQCESDWICAGQIVTPSKYAETSIYCDDDFYGELYLDKLNVKKESILELIDKMCDFTKSRAYIEGDVEYATLTLGSYNLAKIQNGQYNDVLKKFIEKGWRLR